MIRTFSNLVIVFILTIFSPFFLFSQTYDCEHAGLSKEVKELEIMVMRNYWRKGIFKADSLLEIFSERGMMECKEALWVKHSKADALEYGADITGSTALYHEILFIALKNKYWEILAETYLSLARTHEIAGRGLDAKRNLDEAQKLIDNYNLEKTRARLSVRASSYYRIYEQRPDTAFILAQNAVRLGKKHNYWRTIADGYMLLGMLEENPIKRLIYFSSGRDENIRFKAYHGVITLNNSVADIQIDLNNLDEAEETVRKTFEYDRLLIKESGEPGFYNFFGRYNAHNHLKEIYEKRGMLDSMNYHQEMAQKYESIFERQDDQKIISEIEIKNAVEIEQLKTEIVNQKLIVSRWIIGAGLVLLSLGGIFVYVLYKNSQKIKTQNNKIVIQNEQLGALNYKQGILLSEIHHRVKNNCQTIASILVLEDQNIQDPTAKEFLKEVSTKIFSIALIHEQLYKDDNFEIVDMSVYFNDLGLHLKKISSGLKNFDFEISTNEIALNIETAMPLGLICAELITNSIKYAKSEVGLFITIELIRISNSKYLFKYRDNGNGYKDLDLEHFKKGMGMVLIQKMKRQLKADLEIRNNNGAEVKLLFEEKILSKI